MTFKPKFSSYRSRIAVLAVVLCVNAFVAIHSHHRDALGAVILAVAAILAAAIPESPAKKPQPEKYPFTPRP